MSLGPIHSGTRNVALKRSAGARVEMENPSKTGLLLQDTPCRRRRDYYTSAGHDRRAVSRSETTQSDPFRHTPRLHAGFVAQVIGQVLDQQSAPRKSAYDAEKLSSIRALLLDRKI